MNAVRAICQICRQVSMVRERQGIGKASVRHGKGAAPHIYLVPLPRIRKGSTRVFEGGGGEKVHPLGQAQGDGERGVRGGRDDEGALEEGGQRAGQKKC